MKSWNEIRKAARKFVEYWTLQRGSEKGEDQQFWNMLLRDVLGMNDVEQRVKPQVSVQMKGTTKFLDFWIPETRVLIEHKSRGANPLRRNDRFPGSDIRLQRSWRAYKYIAGRVFSVAAF